MSTQDDLTPARMTEAAPGDDPTMVPTRMTSAGVECTHDETERDLPTGHIRWHCSDEDGGPDVGLELNMGEGHTLWIGDITRREAESNGLPDDKGWWFVHHKPDKTRVYLARVHDLEDIGDLNVREWLEQLSAGYLAALSATPPREPTEAMLIAARDWSYDKYGKPIGNDAARGCWQAMFDAALAAPAPSEADAQEHDDLCTCVPCLIECMMPDDAPAPSEGSDADIVAWLEAQRDTCKGDYNQRPGDFQAVIDLIGQLRQDAPSEPASPAPEASDALPDREGLDGTARLCRALYGRKERAADYLGGSDARMLHDAADRLASPAPDAGLAEVLLRAVEPFARATGWIPQSWYDGHKLEEPPGDLTVGHFRRLREAYLRTPPQAKDDGLAEEIERELCRQEGNSWRTCGPRARERYRKVAKALIERCALRRTPSQAKEDRR